jgi:hypothetical protein
MTVAAAEIELSLQAYEWETKDGGYWNLFNTLSVPGKLIRIPAQ